MNVTKVPEGQRASRAGKLTFATLRESDALHGSPEQPCMMGAGSHGDERPCLRSCGRCLPLLRPVPSEPVLPRRPMMLRHCLTPQARCRALHTSAMKATVKRCVSLAPRPILALPGRPVDGGIAATCYQQRSTCVRSWTMRQPHHSRAAPASPAERVPQRCTYASLSSSQPLACGADVAMHGPTGEASLEHATTATLRPPFTRAAQCMHPRRAVPVLSCCRAQHSVTAHSMAERGLHTHSAATSCALAGMRGSGPRACMAHMQARTGSRSAARPCSPPRAPSCLWRPSPMSPHDRLGITDGPAWPARKRASRSGARSTLQQGALAHGGVGGAADLELGVAALEELARRRLGREAPLEHLHPVSLHHLQQRLHLLLCSSQRP